MVKHLLQQHRVKVITSADNEDLQHVRVRRSYIFSDALRQFSRESFACSKHYEFALLVRQLSMMVDLEENFFIFCSRKCLNRHTLVVFQNMSFQFMMLKRYKKYLFYLRENDSYLSCTRW